MYLCSKTIYYMIHDYEYFDFDIKISQKELTLSRLRSYERVFKQENT